MGAGSASVAGGSPCCSTETGARGWSSRASCGWALGWLCHSTWIPKTNMKPKEFHLLHRSHPKGLGLPPQRPRGGGVSSLSHRGMRENFKDFPLKFYTYEGGNSFPKYTNSCQSLNGSLEPILEDRSSLPLSCCGSEAWFPGTHSCLPGLPAAGPQPHLALASSHGTWNSQIPCRG